ncbi:ribosomal l51/s25/CI-B8 domain-containing protein [Ceratobasidium sp. AG-Ba]|nr:ribosomal l51/s25/CI-B8 domain-containing protein [Ceratobasidium sp. AG-Ba]QRV91702.1 ribosomal l51/s25/CI-B8 domain-containing protein [Ceratobasidium sp. AG-Ba]
MSAAPKKKLTTIGKTMAFLHKQPIPYLKSNVKSLELRLAPRNGHWGARHFLKEDLPRIAYANPHVTYRVDKSRQLTIEKPWAPSLRLEFDDGSKHNVGVDGKLSGEIMKEVLSVAGGSPPNKQAPSPEA